MGKKTKAKFYVVWKGHQPGIFDNWEACKKSISDFKGAQYISFETEEEAKKAFQGKYTDYIGKPRKKKKLSQNDLKRIGKPNLHSISVDAAVGGNPGKLEYRGVDTGSGKELFRQGPFPEGTNNIGEFLAIVHGLAWLAKRNSDRIIYTDSRTAMSWVRKKKCNTKLTRSDNNAYLFELVSRAENWLEMNSYNTKVVKWETAAWGEIPADFGRK